MSETTFTWRDLRRELVAVRLRGDLQRIKHPETGRKVWDAEDREKLALHAIKTAHGLVKSVHDNLPAKHQNPDLFKSRSAGRVGMARRVQYRGRDERRFVGDLRPGQETRRYGSHRRLEVRNLTGGKGTLVEVEGEPIRYRSPYPVRDAFGEFEETMLPGVARYLLATADTRFLFNHDGLPLARTTSGSLKLIDTPTALRFAATVDTRQKLANDLVIAIERGDVSQMSVGFIVADDTWNENFTVREISRFEQLLDVSAVTYPASPTTTIALAGAGDRVWRHFHRDLTAVHGTSRPCPVIGSGARESLLSLPSPLRLSNSETS